MRKIDTSNEYQTNLYENSSTEIVIRKTNAGNWYEKTDMKTGAKANAMAIRKQKLMYRQINTK